MSQTPKVSLILATFNSFETIDTCLDSLAAQDYAKEKLEVVVVIDGPNQEYLGKIESHRETFVQRGITFVVEMLETNMGRFAAQRHSARIATGEFIIFMGDRISLPPSYVSDIVALDEEIVIPDVHEVNWHKSIINTFMHQVRAKLFSRNPPTNKMYIDANNFERTAKGNGGMLVRRQLYLDTCEQMNVGMSEKHVSDDTRMLKSLIEQGHRLCRSLDICINYQPRNSLRDQLRHLYERGPRFVDYYIHRGTRFHNFLLVLFISPWLVLAGIYFFHVNWMTVVIAAFIGDAVLSTALSSRPIHFIKLLVAIPLVGLSFYSGLIKGLIHYALARNHRIKNYLSFFILVATVILFVRYIVANHHEFSRLSDLNYGFLILIIFGNIMSLFINGIFIKIALEPFDKKIPVLESFYVSLISSVGNFFAPGGTGIGIRGVYLKRKHNVSYSDFLNTVAGNYVIVFFVISVGGLTSLGVLGSHGNRGFTILLLAFAALFIIDFFLMTKQFSKHGKRLIASPKLKLPGKAILLNIFEGWELLTHNKKVLARLIALALFGYAVSLANNFFILKSLHISTSFAGLTLLVALSSLSVFINITPGNIGIKEALLVSSAQIIGLSTSETLSYAIVDRTVLFFILFFGWAILHVFRATRKTPELID
jgi:uncharacterized protein (TIRG00374 family)